MTNEFPRGEGARSPLGSAVTLKSRIDRYLASFPAALLPAMGTVGASLVPQDVSRMDRHERLGLQGLAPAPVWRHAGETLARGRVAHVQRARDQRIVLHAD